MTQRPDPAGDIQPTPARILHLDLDAFFAAVEQRDKPSLRGKPVVVGGLGHRGVVATASYEARRFGVRSAMRTAEARALCPHAAFLSGRFAAYREASRLVMERLRAESPLVEPLSLDEAYLDLAAGGGDIAPAAVRQRVDDLLADVRELTGGLTASVGVASSKFMAKIASEINKPDGVFIVEPGTEADLIGPLQVTVIPGVGPATAERLRRLGVVTVEDLRSITLDDLTGTVGQAHGTTLWNLARAVDHRRVLAERETKSISVEDTFDHDVSDRAALRSTVQRMAHRVTGRLQRQGWSARTVTLKARRHDFETLSRSLTLPAPTDSPKVITETAERLLAGIDTAGGLRLVGVGVSGLSDWVQPDLFEDEACQAVEVEPDDGIESVRPTHWLPGVDVHHQAHGDGWVWGSGLGRVTVRFETRDTPPGPVHTFAADDPALTVRVGG